MVFCSSSAAENCLTEFPRNLLLLCVSQIIDKMAYEQLNTRFRSMNRPETLITFVVFLCVSHVFWVTPRFIIRSPETSKPRDSV